jgi:hypothetical protein
MAIAAEAFELLGDRDDVALLEILRAGFSARKSQKRERSVREFVR